MPTFCVYQDTGKGDPQVWGQCIQGDDLTYGCITE